MMATGYFIFIFVLGTLILLLFAFFIVMFWFVHKKKRYEHLLEKQQLENNYRTQLLQSKLEVQEESFKHFSEEIHDNIGQMLSIAKMQLYSIRNGSGEPETVKKAGDCGEILGKAINELRNISHVFNAGYIGNVGLAAAIEKDLEYIRSAKEIACTLHRQGEEYSLGSDRELLVFRIVQEAIGNAVKHASAAAIDVSLDYQPDVFCIEIRDNGVGFDTDLPRKGGGIGLGNMQMRAGLLKGAISLSSEKGKGTLVKLVLAAE